MLKRILVVLLLVPALFTETCWAEQEKSDDILKLLVITGSLEQAKDVVTYLSQAELATMGEREDEISQRAVSIIEEETVKILTSQFDADSPLVTELVTIYADVFTHDEIKAILNFYESEIGLKLIASMPQIMERSMLAGQLMSNSIQPLLRDNILLRLEQEGIELAP